MHLIFILVDGSKHAASIVTVTSPSGPVPLVGPVQTFGRRSNNVTYATQRWLPADTPLIVYSS